MARIGALKECRRATVKRRRGRRFFFFFIQLRKLLERDLCIDVPARFYNNAYYVVVKRPVTSCTDRKPRNIIGLWTVCRTFNYFISGMPADTRLSNESIARGTYRRACSNSAPDRENGENSRRLNVGSQRIERFPRAPFITLRGICYTDWLTVLLFKCIWFYIGKFSEYGSFDRKLYYDVSTPTHNGTT